MDVQINNLTLKKINKKFIKRVVEKAVKLVNLKGFNELSIVFVRDKKIKELNKLRGRNEITDILTFDYGEIFICPSQVKKNELGIILIHGILHLAGYNDQTEEEYNKIINKQEEIWQKIIS